MSSPQHSPSSEPPLALARRWWQEDADGRTRAELLLAALQDARRTRQPPAETDLRGVRMLDADLAGVDLSRCDLRGADLSRADLRGARFHGADLRGCVLQEARLDDADLTSANLECAQLSGVHAVGTGFGHARLAGANLFHAHLTGSTFAAADLSGADLRTARMASVSLRDAVLTSVDATGTCLQEADLHGARLDRACFDGADLRRASVTGAQGYPTASWIGTDVRDVDFCGAWLMRRHVLDENYLHEFRHQSTLNLWVYRLWWLSSDCGRSATRWAGWTVIIALIFAGVYQLCDVDYGSHETWLSPLYYSVVTLTTLGYGDVLPASAGAQLAAMLQVVIGYVMLGGLMSIFSNKMARRAD